MTAGGLLFPLGKKQPADAGRSDIIAAFRAGEKRRKSLSFRLSPPTTEELTLLRAPIRGFASKPAPPLTLLVPPPLNGSDIGADFFILDNILVRIYS